MALISIKRHSVIAEAFCVGLMQGIQNMKMRLLFDNCRYRSDRKFLCGIYMGGAYFHRIHISSREQPSDNISHDRALLDADQ